MTNKDCNHKLISNGLELLLLGFIFISILLQMRFGNENVYSQIIRIFSIAGFSFHAGYYSLYNSSTPVAILKKGGFYGLLFLLFGLLHQVGIYRNNLLKSFVWLVTLEKIPEPSDVFFTLTVLYVCSFLLAKNIHWLTKNKYIPIILSLLALSVIFIPTSIFDYPLLGVFFGCDTYNCTALLPYTLYWFLGIYAYKACSGKVFLLISILLTVIAGITYILHLSSIAYIALMCFPVMIAFYFAKHFIWYQKLANLPWTCLHYIDNKICKSICDANGKLKKNIVTYLIVFSLLFIAIIAISYSPFWLSGRTIVWKRDALSQYVPRAYYFADYVRTLVSQFMQGNFNIPTYDFRIGFGSAVSFSSEPLYLLFALLPASRVEFAYNAILILRLYLAGLSMSALLLYFKKDYYDTLFGALMYTFCEFALYCSVVHAHFISPMILLPLLIIGTEEVFRKNRWYLCTISVALALLSSYYFIYMSTLTMGIYYVARFIFTHDKSKKTIKNFITTTFLFGSSYLLGVLIGNLPLFTSFSNYLGSGRTGDSSLTTPSFFSYGYNWLTKFFTSFITVPSSTNYWLKLGFIPLAYIAIIILFLRKERKMIKSLFVLYTAFCIFPVAGYVFSGFSVVTNRWCYIYAFLITFITVCMLPTLRTLSKRELMIISASIVPYALIALISKNYQVTALPTSFAMLLITFIVVILINENFHFVTKEQASKLLVALCIGSVLINSFMLYTEGTYTTPDNFARENDALDAIERTPLKAISTVEDDSFYRATSNYISNKHLNSSLVLDYNSITVFSSTVNGTIADYNALLGNSTWSMILYQGFDNRTMLNTLSNVKYYTINEGEEAYLPYGYKYLKTEEMDDAKYSVYENQYELPLGYTYSNVITEDELSAYSTAERQEILLQAATVADKSVDFKNSDTKFINTAQTIDIESYEANGIEFTETGIKVIQPGATLTLHFNSIPKSETFLEYTGTYEPETNPKSNVVRLAVTCPDNTIRNYTMRSDKHTYATYQDAYIFNLGYHQDTINSCTISFSDIGTFDYDSFKLYCQPMDNYTSCISKLTEDTLENVVMTSNSIKGEISLTENKFMVLGIPYQKGWTAYVDGKETSIEKANIMYSGLYLEPGDHTIELYYERPGLKLSLLLSGIGILILAVSLIIRRKRIKMMKSKTN